MPTYDYCCDANGQVIEVSHRMNEAVVTWGELCERLGMPPGDTPGDTPVKKLITGSHVVNSARLGSGQAPPCETGAPCCGGMACGLN
jgi:hypothetical protein